MRTTMLLLFVVFASAQASLFQPQISARSETAGSCLLHVVDEVFGQCSVASMIKNGLDLIQDIRMTIVQSIELFVEDLKKVLHGCTCFGVECFKTCIHSIYELLSLRVKLTEMFINLQKEAFINLTTDIKCVTELANVGELSGKLVQVSIKYVDQCLRKYWRFWL